MRVGFLGLGRLGLPIAAVLSQHHRVTGYDPDPSTAERLKMGHPWEVGLTEFLNDRIALAPSVDAATYDAEVVVVCVQTPHDLELDGTHDTDKRAPFDLSYVTEALGEIENDSPVVLMSTVLPGDCRRLAPLISGELIYAPAFPAMGTTISDFLAPEFHLIGAGTVVPVEIDILFEPIWPTWGYERHFETSWETAELAKMAYNTAIGAKIALANTVGWLAHEADADGHMVMEILRSADRRIISDAYLRPGLGDGGACHPRDQIALSWLARRYGVWDLFGALIDQRSAHSKWIAELAKEHGLPVCILGAEYKANSTLADGSPALLLSNQTGWPVVDAPPSEPHVIIIGVPHDRFATLDLSAHVVIDPWHPTPDATHDATPPPSPD